MLAKNYRQNLVKELGTILVAVGFMIFGGTNALAQNPQYDFDGDGKTDISTWGTDDAEFWHLKSSNGGNGAAQFGNSESDVPIPADYTGDGKADSAFFRYTTGEWFILRSEDGSFYSFPFGIGGNSTDTPVPGDYDGDGITDPAIYRLSTGFWYVKESTTGQVRTEYFGGTQYDIPVPADYDGDGKEDLAIYRFSLGEWWLNQSTDGLVVYSFILEVDRFEAFVMADFTGDGKVDPAFVLRPSNSNLNADSFGSGSKIDPLMRRGVTDSKSDSLGGGDGNLEWFVLRSEDQSFYSFPYGIEGDIPAIGDYDGDGTTDPAVYRPDNGKWYLNQSTAGFSVISFGTDRDYPMPGVRYKIIT